MATVGSPAGGVKNPHAWTGAAMSMPALQHDEITPHDTNLLPFLYRAVWCNGAGDIKYWCVGDDDAGTVRTVTLAAGTWFPAGDIARILATGTTATGLKGFH